MTKKRDNGTKSFYDSYSEYKSYEPVSLSAKDVTRYDNEIWKPAEFRADMACLEVGSGTGGFLSYLAQKGVSNFYGIDHDDNLTAVQPVDVEGKFEAIDVWEYLGREDVGPFDRVVMLDVLEHFTPDDGHRLLNRLANRLKDDGRIVVKVPNASSPWGLSYQYGDLTHLAAYTPDSLRQIGIASGLTTDIIYGQTRGSRKRQVLDRWVNKFLSSALLAPPEIWSANIYAIFSKQ